MKLLTLLLITVLLFALSCSQKPAELGSKKNPIKMFFVPSQEAGKIISNSTAIKNYLTETTGYEFKTAVPTSYAAVIEAMGTGECDIAWLATFAYILAHEKYGAEVALTTVRKGLTKYRGQFVARAGSGIDSIPNIQGKTIAYTDAASTSGYIYPSLVLAREGIKPASYIFAGGHNQAIISVYEGKTDVGCTYWSPETEDGPQDARRAVAETYPDIYEKVKIIGFTDWIPNDTVTFRKDFPPEMREKIVSALLDFVSTPNGKKVMDELYSINGFVKASDADYNVVRQTLEKLGMSASEYVE